MSRGNDKLKGTIWDVEAPLTGKGFKRAVGALTRLETNPQINAYRGDLRAIALQRRREQQALARLNANNQRATTANYGALDKSLGDYENRVGELGREGYARSGGIATEAAQRMGAINTDAVTAAQNSQLAGGRGAGIADAAAMREQLASTQDQSAMAQAMGRYSSDMATSMGQSASDMRANQASVGANARQALTNAITSRRMDSRNQYNDAEMQTRNELKTARSLKGATRVKNALALRDAEKKGANERLALLLDAKANNQDYRADLAAIAQDDRESIRDGRGDDGGGGGGGGGDDDTTPRRMTGGEWNEWRALINQERDGGPIGPGTWNGFLTDAAEDRNIDWTGRERNQFTRRYKKWYENNTNF
jgi:hypothetical protein